jgi:hypothetical protein
MRLAEQVTLDDDDVPMLRAARRSLGARASEASCNVRGSCHPRWLAALTERAFPRERSGGRLTLDAMSAPSRRNIALGSRQHELA